MGKAANARAWAEYEHRQQREQQEHDEVVEPLSEAERDEQASDLYYERLDAARQYALPVARVRLFDETQVGR